MLFTLICALPAAAQNERLLASADTGRNKDSLSDRQEFAPTKKPLIRFELDLSIGSWLKNTKPFFPDYWTTYAHQPNHTYITQYKGLHGVIEDVILHQINRYHKKYLRELWNNSTLHPTVLDAKIRDYHVEASDSRYRGWDKDNWYDYYPLEKGGSGLRIHTIGHTYAVISVGPLDITNTGRVSLSRWRLSIDRLDDDETSIDKDIVNTDPRLKDKDKDVKPRPVTGRDLSLGIKPPTGNIYTGDSWTLSGSVKVNVKFDL